jgi:hypothetical protein
VNADAPRDFPEGAGFLTPPQDNGYEIRCFFRDSDGHLLELSQAR